MKVLTIVLLSLAFNKAYTSPIPQCPFADPSSGDASDVYDQNNGQPVVVYAYPEPLPDGASPLDSASLGIPPSASAALPTADLSGLSLPTADLSGLSSPIASPVLSAPAQPSSPTDLETAQIIADQASQDANGLPLETLPGSNQPCKIETQTEVVEHPGETFVHHPGPIYINQPPTRLVINHAPFVIRPSPIVLNQGSRTVTKAITKKILPGQVHVRPIVVRIVKPIEKKVLIEKPTEAPLPSQSIVVQPQVPSDLCSEAISADSSAFPSSPFASAPIPALSTPDFSPILSVPAAPAVPSYPSIPSIPSIPAIPSIPSIPSIPLIPSAPSLPPTSPFQSPPAIPELALGNAIDLSQAGPVELQQSCGCAK